MSLEATLRQIIREELEAFAELREGPRPEKTHMGSTELCAALGISRGTLRRMMDEGCPHVRPGSTPRFNMADVQRFLNAKREASNGHT